MKRYSFSAIGEAPFFFCYTEEEKDSFKAALLSNGLPFTLSTYDFDTRETKTQNFNNKNNSL